MKTLLDALNDGLDIGFKPQAQSNKFVSSLPGYIKTAVDNYVRYGKDLNDTIRSIAEKNKLNDDQIQRVVEGANNQVYLIIYEKGKGNLDREVKFELASLPKVKGREISSEKLTKGTSKAAGNLMDGLEKVASEEIPFTVLQNSKTKMRNIDNTDTKLENLKKLATEYHEVHKEIEKVAASVVSSFYDISDVLIQSHLTGYDHQAIYDYISKKASFDDSDKEMMKSAFEEKLDFLRKDRPSIYCPIEMSIDFYGKEITKEAFSLGDRSLSKTASEEIEPKVPVVTVNKKTAKSINDLIGLAEKAKTDKDAVNHLIIKRNDIAKTAKFSDEILEKLATGKGVKSFVEALTGINTMRTRKALKKSIGELEGKLSNPEYIKAQDALESATKAVKNPYTDKRMSGINNIVKEKANKLQESSLKTDDAINQYNLRAPLEKMFHPIENVKDKAARLNRYIHNNEVKSALKAQESQAARIKADSKLTSRNAEKNLETVKGELGIGDTNKKIEDLSGAYQKAVQNRRKARTATGLVAGGGALAYNEMKNKNQSAYPVY